ncbi:MAG: hypothetical protein IPJ46_09445 [Anaerolineales bacterium]|nr:hypothetical protein [Anaerolineales bacterium]
MIFTTSYLLQPAFDRDVPLAILPGKVVALSNPFGKSTTYSPGSQSHGITTSVHTMNDKPLDITDFLKLILEALKASGIEYMIGGAIAGVGLGEPRATQDLDIVINLPIKAIGKFSKELEKRKCSSQPTLF